MKTQKKTVAAAKAGSVEWRGKNKDYARLVVTLPSDGKSKRNKIYKNLGQVTPEEAAAELAQFSLLFSSVLDADKAKITFGQLVERWKKLRWQANELKPKTRQRYNEILDSRILPVLKDKKLRDIKATDIEDLMNNIKTSARKDKKAGTLSGQTLLHHYVLLKTVFAYALDCDLLHTSPVKKQHRPKVKHIKTKSYNREETDRLINMLKDVDLQHQAMIRLPLAIGCRLGELAGLRWNDIDFETGIVSIKATRQYIDKANGVVEGTPKTEKSSRECYVPQIVIDILAEFKAEVVANQKFLGRELAEEAFVFVNANGQPLYPSSPNAWFREFLARHKLPKITFHGLRHTCASLLLAQGIDAAAIADLLGHSTPVTTLNTYLHPTNEAMRRIVTIMNDIQKGSDNASS